MGGDQNLTKVITGMGVDWYPCAGGCEGVACDAADYARCEECSAWICDSCMPGSKVGKVYLCEECSSDVITRYQYIQIVDHLLTLQTEFKNADEVRDYLRKKGTIAGIIREKYASESEDSGNESDPPSPKRAKVDCDVSK